MDYVGSIWESVKKGMCRDRGRNEMGESSPQGRRPQQNPA